MTKDANEFAREYERRENMHYSSSPKATVIRGRLELRDSPWSYGRSRVFEDATLDINKPGVLLVYESTGEAHIFYPRPGWYFVFTPDHAGE